MFGGGRGVSLSNGNIQQKIPFREKSGFLREIGRCNNKVKKGSGAQENKKLQVSLKKDGGGAFGRKSQGDTGV